MLEKLKSFMEQINSLLLYIAKNMRLAAYPVGSIYMSLSSTNPSTLFGGTWVQIKDTFLLAAGSTYKAGSSGGEATHKLTINEMPSHRHSIRETNNTQYVYTSKVSENTGTSNYAAFVTRRSSYSNGSDYFRLIAEYYGGSEAHNNMPPYYTVYMWRRTA